MEDQVILHFIKKFQYSDSEESLKCNSISGKFTQDVPIVCNTLKNNLNLQSAEKFNIKTLYKTPDIGRSLWYTYLANINNKIKKETQQIFVFDFR